MIARVLALLAAVAVAIVLLTGSGTPLSRAARPAAAPAPHTRYSLAHGCYLVHTGSGPKLGPFTMQPAALGSYLLYGVKGDYLGPSLTQEQTPDDGAIWTVTGSSRSGFTLTNAATATALHALFIAATGCASYPEAEVGAAGPAFTGASPEGAVQGTVEGHAHVTALELFGGDWHCGRPWSRFGAPYALPASCAPYEQGTNGEVEAFLDFGSATRPSDMHGWPTFVAWPSPTALAEEGDYWTAIERAWKAGLRLMVTNLVDNEALCMLMSNRHNPCNDMASVRIQSRDLYALQDYIDAQAGGPGRGFFRVVTDPFQARRVINAGKLAVIEGIEVSRILGCGEVNGVPQCDRAQIDAGLKEIRNLGVRTFFPVHEFNNAFGGTKMIEGETGAIINAGNRLETGSFWTLQPCSAQDQDAPQVSFEPTGVLAQLFNGQLSSLLGGNPVPVYGSGPQCNTQGLTDLGAYLIGQMIKQHLIIQLDHMDSKTASAALAIAEQHRYSGVASAHCCNSPQLFGRIYRVGGFVNPQKDQAAPFRTVYGGDKAQHSSLYYFGFGYGSDMNGLSAQPGPDASNPIHYPFKSFDGRVTFTQERWGDRKFNLDTDGLANYGLYADWLQSVQRAGGTNLMSDMFRGAEAYLEMWERAYGVPGPACLSRAPLTARGFGPLDLGDNPESTLYRAGQPSARPGRSYRYCLGGGAAGVARGLGRGFVSAVFDGHERLTLIAGNAPGLATPTLRVGQQVNAARLHALKLVSLGVGRWLGPALPGGARYVFIVRGNRMTATGVATTADARSTSALLADLRGAGL